MVGTERLQFVLVLTTLGTINAFVLNKPGFSTPDIYVRFRPGGREFLRRML